MSGRGQDGAESGVARRGSPPPPAAGPATIAAAALLPHTAALAAMAAPPLSTSFAASAAEKPPFALSTYPFGLAAGPSGMAAAAAALAAQMYQQQLAAAELGSSALGQAARQALDASHYPWITALTGKTLTVRTVSVTALRRSYCLPLCAPFVPLRAARPAVAAAMMAALPASPPPAPPRTDQ